MMSTAELEEARAELEQEIEERAGAALCGDAFVLQTSSGPDSFASGLPAASRVLRVTLVSIDCVRYTRGKVHGVMPRQSWVRNVRMMLRNGAMFFPAANYAVTVKRDNS
jgi:hypothetical protein